MKSIFKILLLVVTLVPFLIQCEKEEPEPEPMVEIPDNNFLNALIELGIDTNGDGQISNAEAEGVVSLDVRGTYETPGEIANIKGIEAFVNLDTLDCRYNQLNTLDISKNTALKWLSCGYNLLSTLDISNNIALEWLYCSHNQLTELDVSTNNSMTFLYCPWNLITSLDVSNNVKLEHLFCNDNQLTSLDLSNNTSLVDLFLQNMTSLHEVCVWTMPFPPAGVTVDITGSPSVYFTTACSK